MGIVLFVGITLIVMGAFDISYATMMGSVLLSCFLFVAAKTKTSYAGKFLDYSLSGLFMMDATMEIMEITRGVKIIAVHPSVRTIYAILLWMAIISFIAIVINWVKNISQKPPEE